jgi:hypothetical protein
MQKRVAAAIQNTPGRRPAAASEGGGVSIAMPRLRHQASTGTTSEASSAIRQPASSTAVKDSTPTSRR